MKRKIDEGEWYPVYSLCQPDAYGGHEIEVTEEQVARWEAAEVAFKKAQGEMGDLHRAAGKVERERASVEKAEREAADKAERLERQWEIEEKNRRYREAVAKIVGPVYDADGNLVGTVNEGSMGLKVNPLTE